VTRDHDFWRRWFTVGAVYGAGAGMFLVVVAFSEAASAQVFRLAFLLEPDAAGAASGAARQATAVSGALTLGLGVVAYMLRPGTIPEPAFDRRAGRAIAIGLGVWFVIDSAASVGMGAAINVIGNVTFLLALLPPSIALARARGTIAA
jgi:hypothetical protein